MDEKPKKGPGRPRNADKAQAQESDIQARIDRYRQDFDLSTLTAIDETMLKNMAALEIGVERINQQLTNPSSLEPSEVKALADSVKVFLAESRQQAKALGIDRASRMTEEESQLETYLPQLAKDAKDFLYQYAIQIICHTCRESQGHPDIRLGTIIYHFKDDGEWRWESKCPRCGGQVILTPVNWEQFTLKWLEEHSQHLQRSDNKDHGEDDQNETGDIQPK